MLEKNFYNQGKGNKCFWLKLKILEFNYVKILLFVAVLTRDSSFHRQYKTWKHFEGHKDKRASLVNSVGCNVLQINIIVMLV